MFTEYVGIILGKINDVCLPSMFADVKGGTLRTEDGKNNQQLIMS